MKCSQIRERLERYVIGEIVESERRSVEEHLCSCPDCRREERLVRLLITSLESDTIAQPSSLFVESVMEQLPNPVPFYRSLVFQYLTALALGSIVLGGYLFWHTLVGWIGGFRDSLAYVVSRLDPAPLLQSSFFSRIELFYLAAMGFAWLLIVVATVSFARYYRKPLHYH